MQKFKLIKYYLLKFYTYFYFRKGLSSIMHTIEYEEKQSMEDLVVYSGLVACTARYFVKHTSERCAVLQCNSLGM